MGRLLNIGRLFGIPLRLHFTWFIIFTLVVVSLVYPDYYRWSSWVVAIIGGLLFFVSVLAHELAHSLIGRANGVPINTITLFIFGGMAEMTREATNPRAELKMAIAGPICSALISLIFGAVWFLVPNLPPNIASIVFWLAAANGLLALFNLIPGFPLDGGRVLRSILWLTTRSYIRATRIAAAFGQGIGYLFIVGGITAIIFRPFSISWFDGIWLALIGWFLVRIARNSYRQIHQQEIIQYSPTFGATVPDSPPDISPDDSPLGTIHITIDNKETK